MKSKIRVGIDGRCLEGGQISGVGEYTIEIMKNIFKLADDDVEFAIFTNSFSENKSDWKWLGDFKNVRLCRFRIPNKILNILIWYFSWPAIDKLIGGVDVFFAPNMNFIALSDDCPMVIVVHDLSFEIFPRFYAVKSRLWHWFINLPNLIKRSKAVIAVSENTADDIAALYGFNKKAIKVVHHGWSPEYHKIDRNDERLKKVQKKYHLPKRFILYLGNVEQRKNVRSLIRAFSKLKEDEPSLTELRLVIAGSLGSGKERIIEEAKKSNFYSEILFLGYVDREDKVFIYNLAEIFVYPSFYEGFGLPVLEAMACALPVITSNVSSLPEVAGSSAVLVDPYRPEEILIALKELLLNTNLLKKLSEKSTERVKKFSWEKSAKETLKILKEVAIQRKLKKID